MASKFLTLGQRSVLNNVDWAALTHALFTAAAHRHSVSLPDVFNVAVVEASVFGAKKQARLPLEERQERSDVGAGLVSSLLQLLLARTGTDGLDRRIPAAMATGVVDRLLSFDDLFNELLMCA